MSATWHVGDTRRVLASLPAASVDLVLSSPPFLALRSYLPADDPAKADEMGSEPTPGAFIDALLDVVEACERVLAPHGSLCFELGDTYSGSGGAGGDYNAGGLREGQAKFDGSNHRPGRIVDHDSGRRDPGPGWPLDKSLCLIPESFRWALVYGRNPFTGRETPRWRARNVIRWVRPNPPVGSLGDKFRPATSEMVVACKARDRYFDLDAVRGPHARDYSAEVPGGDREYDRNGRGRRAEAPRTLVADPAGAPPLDWWAIPTQGYAGSHYAVWPKALLLKPIKAMCPERVCRTCGEPSRRIVEPSERYDAERCHGDFFGKSNARVGLQGARLNGRPNAEYVTLGWTDCGHDDWRTGVVLDPFGGSGTTADVAGGLGRDSVSIDLDVRNLDLAQDRLGMFPLDVVDHREQVA